MTPAQLWLERAREAAVYVWEVTRPEPDEPVAPSRADTSARWLIRVVLGGLLCGYAVIALRLYTVQVAQHERWSDRAARQHVRVRAVPAERGRLLLRDQEGLVPGALSVTRGSLLIEGRDDRDIPATLDALESVVTLLPGERQALAERMERGRAFYFRRHGLDQDQVDALRAARLPHVTIEVDPDRAYPFEGLAPQVLGLVDADGRGSVGLEAVLDEHLRGTPGEREVLIDNKRNEFVTLGNELVPPQPGQDVVLSLHRSVQAVVDAELARVAEEHSPQGAAAVVVDVHTGAILGLGSWPTFNPAQIEGDFHDALRCRAITDTYEPGSTIKPLFISTVWELGLGGPERAIDCPRTFKVPGRRKRIVDVHTVGRVTESEVIVQSSNTGAYQLTSRLSPAQIRRVIEGFGLGRRTGLPLPGESSGNTRSLARLDPTTLGSLAQGYAISVTPVQMALAYAALANGGTLYRSQLVLQRRDAEGRILDESLPQAVSRPLSSPVTRAALRDALVDVVNGEHGTARRARSETYTIAGKTGTSKLLVDGRYDPRDIVGSFCGFAPAEDPQIAFCVVVWGPDSSQRRVWGGTTAAPAAGRIAEQTLHLLHVPPSPRPEETER